MQIGMNKLSFKAFDLLEFILLVWFISCAFGQKSSVNSINQENELVIMESPTEGVSPQACTDASRNAQSDATTEVNIRRRISERRLHPIGSRNYLGTHSKRSASSADRRAVVAGTSMPSGAPCGGVAGSVFYSPNAALNVMAFGAVASGISHPLSADFETLAAAQAVYPFVTSLSQERDWAAIQAAINAVPWPAGCSTNTYHKVCAQTTVFIPSGVYKISSNIALRNNVNIQGNGYQNTNLMGVGATSLLNAYSASSDNSDNIKISDLSLTGDGTSGGTGIYMSGSGGRFADQIVIDNVLVQGFYNGIYLGASYFIDIKNSWVNSNTNYGMLVDGAVTTISAYKTAFQGNGHEGVYISSASGRPLNDFECYSCTFEGNGLSDSFPREAYFGGSKTLLLEAPYIETSATVTGLDISGVGNATIHGGFIRGALDAVYGAATPTLQNYSAEVDGLSTYETVRYSLNLTGKSSFLSARIAHNSFDVLMNLDVASESESQNFSGTSDFQQPGSGHTGTEYVSGLLSAEGGRIDVASSDSMSGLGVENELKYSRDFTQAAWSIGGTVTPNTAVAPDGTTTASTIAWTSNMSGASQYISTSVTIGDTWTCSGWVSGTAGKTAVIGIAGDSTGTAINNLVLTSTLTRYSVSLKFPVRSSHLYCGLFGLGDANYSTSVVVWGFQLNKGFAPRPYVPTSSASISVAPGGVEGLAYYAAGKVGLTAIKTLKGSDGNSCTLTITAGIITATTCP